MPRALPIHVNRSDHHDVDARTKRFVPEGPFVVRIRNHGQGSHVHVSVTGELALDASSSDDNPFLEPDETLEVPVGVTTDLRPAQGSVVVTTGYGRNEVSVDVEVRSESGEDDARSTGEPTGQHAAAASSRAGDGTGSAGGTGSGGGTSSVTSTSSVTGSGVGAHTGSDTGGVAERLSATAAGLRDRAASVGELSPDALSVDAISGGGAGAVLPARPSFDAGTALLVALTLLALLAAGTVLQLFSGPVVTVSVLAVVGTVLAAGVYLLLQ